MPSMNRGADPQPASVLLLDFSDSSTVRNVFPLFRSHPELWNYGVPVIAAPTDQGI